MCVCVCHYHIAVQFSESREFELLKPSFPRLEEDHGFAFIEPESTFVLCDAFRRPFKEWLPDGFAIATLRRSVMRAYFRLFILLGIIAQQQSLWVSAQTLTLLDSTAALGNIPSTTSSVTSLQLPRLLGFVVSTNTTYYLSRIDLALTSGTGERNLALL